MNPEESAPEPGDAAWRRAGHACNIFGLFSFFGMFARARVDLSWIILFWLASALFQRAAWARRLWVSISFLFVAASVSLLALSVFGLSETAEVFKAKNPAPDLAALHLALTAPLLLPVALPLLRKDARLLPPKPLKYVTYGRAAMFYFVAVTLLMGAEVGISKLIRRESIGSSTRFAGSGEARAGVVELSWSDGGSPPRSEPLGFIVVPGSRVQGVGSSSGDGWVEADGVRIQAEPPRSWWLIRPRRSGGENVTLVLERGRGKALPVRISEKNRSFFEAALKECSDVNDLERRLLRVPPD